MKDNPLVSIICLCYNHELYLIESLNSILNQSYQNTEIIIVDDFSSDNSPKIIKQWISQNKIGSFISNETNIGNTKSFNKALKLSSGDYIIDFATDDLLHPDFITCHLQNFKQKRNLNAGVSYCNVELINNDDKHLYYHFEVDANNQSIEKPKEGDIYKELIHSYYLNPIGIFIKREVLEHLDGYDESLLYEDVDFWIRSSRSYPYIYVDKVLAKKRILTTALSAKFKEGGKKQGLMGRSTYKICKKAFYLNKHKLEYEALVNRCTYECKLALKNKDFSLASRFFILMLKGIIKSI